MSPLGYYSPPTVLERLAPHSSTSTCERRKVDRTPRQPHTDTTTVSFTDRGHEPGERKQPPDEEGWHPPWFPPLPAVSLSATSSACA